MLTSGGRDFFEKSRKPLLFAYFADLEGKKGY